jgi:hypothetical protein
MSIKINDEDFTIYPFDTLDSIKERYVTDKYTISKYADLKILEEVNQKSEIKTIDGTSITFLSEMDYKINSYENSSFTCKTVTDIIDQNDITPLDEVDKEKFSKKIDAIYEQITKDTKITISKIDIVFIYMFDTFGTFEQESYEESYGEVDTNIELMGIKEYIKNVSQFDYKDFFESYKKDFTLAQERVKKNIDFFDKSSILRDYKLSKIEDAYMSDVKETQKKYEGEFQLNTDIYELLNKMTPSRELPFLKIARFYKIINFFTVPIVWLEPEDEETENLRMYILKSEIESESNIGNPKSESYVSIKIEQTSEKEGIFKYKYSMTSEGGELVIDEEFILTRFLKHVKKVDEPKEMTLKSTFGKGYFIFNGIDLPREIIYDFSLNDEIVSNIITINEIFKIKKIKGGIRFILMGSVVCNAYIKTILRSSDEEIETFEGNVDVGDKIIRVEIKKAKSEIFLKHALKTLQECFVYMIKNKDTDFYDYYTKYLPNIKSLISKRKVVEESIDNLKDIFPEIYVSGYGRLCANQPVTIINKDDAQKEIEKGNDVMLFPLTSTEGRQSYYTCKSSSHPYVGLKPSNLQNASRYGILPCCYENSQLIKDKTRYMYENHQIDITGKSLIEDDDITKKKSDIIIRTNKILKKDRYGVLPDNITDLLNSVELSTLLGKNRFLRKGVELSPYSCIESLIDALGISESVDSIKNKILKISQYNLASQNMLFPDEVVKIIKSGEHVDPLQFINILENIFQTNIIVFCRDKLYNTEGSFCSPSFKKYLIINEKKSLFQKTVVLYRSFGSEIDKVLYPQTELIVFEKGVNYADKVKSTVVKAFKTESEFIKKLFNLYYSTFDIIKSEVSFVNKAIGQSEDSYGKIRTVKLKLGDTSNEITIYNSPIGPIDFNRFEKGAVSYTDKLSISRYSPEIIKQFFESENINRRDIQKVLYVNNDGRSILIGYYFSKKSLRGFIYSNNYIDGNEISSTIYDTQTNEYVSPLGVGSSLLEQFNLYIKLSNILTSYILYLFSKKYSDEVQALLNTRDNNEFNSGLKNLVNVFEKNIIVVEGHQYKNKIRQLSLKNDSFIKNKEYIIVTSQEIKKRLLYSLYSISKNNLYDVFNYKSKKYIPNFYTTSKDFEQSEHYTIYYTKKELAIYNIDPSLNYKSLSIPPTTEETFFLSNTDILDGHIFLAQKVPSIENAIFTSKFFDKYRINTTDRVSESSLDSTNLSLYVYDGESIINEDIINNKEDTTYILIFKQNNKIYFYSLLKYLKNK